VPVTCGVANHGCPGGVPHAEQAGRVDNGHSDNHLISFTENLPMKWNWFARVCGFTLALLTSTVALAQTNVESNAGIQLDFVNPGARSLALGGAFVGLADDATAAFTNPAGLRFLSRKEVSAEGRSWSFSTPYTSGGRLSGTPSLQGIDQIADLITSESRESSVSPSFLSFVYPGSRWAVAAYRQQISNFKYGATSDGPLVQLADNDARLFPYRAALDVAIARYGVSGSLKVGARASVGAGVSLYDFSMTSMTVRVNVDPNRPGLYAPADLSPAAVRQTTTQTGRERRVGINVGFTATPTSRVQLGGVYRQGARFQFVTTELAGASSPSLPGTFTVPDVLAFGTALRLTQALTLTADYNRVRYSQITDNFTLFFPAAKGFSARAEDFTVDDANEFHAGVEYLFLNMPKPVAIRAGTWNDPDHAIRYEPASLETADPFNLAVFRRGRNVVHGTGGVGVVFGRIEINAAGDFSSQTKTASISTVVRF
jgi:long-chain fatty acid transport protein